MLAVISLLTKYLIVANCVFRFCRSSTRRGSPWTTVCSVCAWQTDICVFSFPESVPNETVRQIPTARALSLHVCDISFTCRTGSSELIQSYQCSMVFFIGVYLCALHCLVIHEESHSTSFWVISQVLSDCVCVPIWIQWHIERGAATPQCSWAQPPPGRKLPDLLPVPAGDAAVQTAEPWKGTALWLCPVTHEERNFMSQTMEWDHFLFKKRSC